MAVFYGSQDWGMGSAFLFFFFFDDSHIIKLTPLNYAT